MSETPPESVQETARALQGALEGFTAQMKAVSDRLAEAEKTQRRLRHIIIGLTISLCLDLLITAGLGYNTVRQDDVQNSSHADLISACQQANVSRLEDAAIWDTFLNDIAPPKAQTPEVKALLAGIDARIEAKDRLRNCAAAYRTQG